MIMLLGRTHRRSRRGAFSLIELTCCGMLFGFIAVLGVPRMLHAVERSRAAEAFEYLDHIHQLQLTHLAEMGTYAAEPTGLDLTLLTPIHFMLVEPEPASSSDRVDRPRSSASWSLTLVRQGASSGYGDYSITFNEQGFAPDQSTISQDLVPLVSHSRSRPGVR